MGSRDLSTQGITHCLPEQKAEIKRKLDSEAEPGLELETIQHRMQAFQAMS